MTKNELIMRLSKSLMSPGAGDERRTTTEAEQVDDQPGSTEANLVTPLLTNLADHQREIINLCEVPRKQTDLMREIGLTLRTFFSRKHLEPLVQAKLIRMTHLKAPNHPKQAYVVTGPGY